VIQLNQDLKIEVSITDAGSGASAVALAFGNGFPVVHLTPLQARAFAMDIIQSVHRAEVRVSLQDSPYRRKAESDNMPVFDKTSWA